MTNPLDIYEASEARPLLRAVVARGGGALIKVGDEFRSLYCEAAAPSLSALQAVECTLKISGVHWPDKSFPPVPGKLIRVQEYRGAAQCALAVEDFLRDAAPNTCLSGRANP